MALVKQKDSKYWQIVIWKDGKHHWYSSRETNEDLARIKESNLIASIRGSMEKNRMSDFIQKCSDKPVGVGLPLDSAWELYLKQPNVAQRSRTTLENKRYHWEGFISWVKSKHSEIRYVQDIDRTIANKYVNSIRPDESKPDYSGGTFNKKKCNISSVFKYLMNDLGLSVNPFAGIVNISEHQKSYRPFTDAEVTKIFKNAKGEWKLACIIALNTGLRLSDVAPLKSSDVNLKEGIIRLPPKKTARYNTWVTVPIRKNLVRLIKPLLKNEYVMPELHIGYVKQSEKFRFYFGKLMDSLNISGKVSFHSFRHTFNDALRRAGVNQEDRMKLTGHSDAKTNDIYTHDISQLRKAVESLPDWE